MCHDAHSLVCVASTYRGQYPPEESSESLRVCDAHSSWLFTAGHLPRVATQILDLKTGLTNKQLFVLRIL